MLLLVISSLIAAASTASGIARHSLDRQKLFVLILSDQGHRAVTLTLRTLKGRLDAPTLTAEDVQAAKLLWKALSLYEEDPETALRLIRAVAPEAVPFFGVAGEKRLHRLKKTIKPKRSKETSYLIDLGKRVQQTDWGMFSARGNEAVREIVQHAIDSSADPDTQYDIAEGDLMALSGKGYASEACDTVVRETVWAYLMDNWP